MAAGIITLLISILCLAFKMTASYAYWSKTQGGIIKTGSYGLSTEHYGDFKRIKIYPDDLMDIVREPLIVATSFGIVLGLVVIWLAVRRLRLRKAVQVRCSSESKPKSHFLTLLV